MKGQQLYFTIVLVTIVSLVGAAGAPLARSPVEKAREVKAPYVEPILYSTAAESLSVVVTAGSSQAAARAVEQVGGRVTSDLWLIGAVAATIPAGQLQALAAYPGIRSIVNNKGVKTAGGPGWDGYVTQQRRREPFHPLEGRQRVPVANLLDGGVISVTDNGHILILNPDGSERARLELEDGPFTTVPVVGTDGTVYLAGGQHVYALYPDGAMRWEFNSPAKIEGGVALSPNGSVHVADRDGHVFALDPATGETQWQFLIEGNTGWVLGTPAVGPDGTVYVVTKNGYLFATNPDGSAQWTFIAQSGQPFKLGPRVGADGTIYFAGEKGQVYALNADGSLKYQFTTAGKIKAQPALGADGRSLYVAAETRTLYGLNPNGSLRFKFRPTVGYRVVTTKYISCRMASMFR